MDGGGARALAVLDDFRLSAFNDGDAAVGRAQIDADNFSHDVFLLLLLSQVSLRVSRGC